MKLKEFLRPSAGKIILSMLLIYHLFLVLTIIGVGIHIECTTEGYRLHPERCGYVKPLIGIDLRLFGGFFSILIIAAALSYLISCTIIILSRKILKMF